LPRYDYKCDACSHRFVEKQSFSSEPVAECPECSSRASRQFVAVPIVFKGSGFYVNDYGKNSSTTKSSSDKESSDKETSSSESSSDSGSKSDSKSTKAETASSSSSSGSSSDSKAD
jgi:putative FmdB family regulatory protein